MNDQTKTKKQLIDELHELRRQIAALQTTENEFALAQETPFLEQDLLRALMDNVPDIIFFKDIHSRFIRTNPAHAEALGLDNPEEAIGKTDFDFFAPEDAQKYYDEEQHIMQSGEPVIARVWVTEFRGGSRWLSENKIPLRDKTGRVVGLVGIGRDITALKQAEALVEHRALQLQTVAEISQATSSILDLDELLPQTVELIRERFKLYYTGLFLVDEAGEWAVLRAGTGEAGSKMLAQGHRLVIGDTSMVGWAASHRQARIALDVGHAEQVVRFDNPLLPDTRSEMALPLISRGEVIGVLDVQSVKPGAFGDEDVAILQTLADQVALAIGNARLFQQVQDNLEAARRAYGELSREGWQRLLQARTDLSFVYDERGLRAASAALEPHIRAAKQTGAIAVAVEDERAVALPIKVREQVIGVINVHKPEQGAWTNEQIALLETLTEQLSVALESARLYQDTQRRAQQEQLTGVITSRMRESLNVETVLQTAVREIHAALGLEEAEVQIVPTDVTVDSEG